MSLNKTQTSDVQGCGEWKKVEQKVQRERMSNPAVKRRLEHLAKRRLARQNIEPLTLKSGLHLHDVSTSAAAQAAKLDCRMGTVNLDYYSEPEVASYNLVSRVASQLEDIKRTCYVRRVEFSPQFRTYIMLDRKLYRSKIVDFTRNYNYINRILEYIYLDYLDSETVHAYPDVDIFVDKYIKAHYRAICRNLNLNKFKNIKYGNKYYKLYRHAEKVQYLRSERKKEKLRAFTERISPRYNYYHKLYHDFDYNTSDDEIFADDESEDVFDFPKPERVYQWDDLTHCTGHYRNIPIAPPPRSKVLLDKLKFILYNFRFNRLPRVVSGFPLSYAQFIARRNPHYEVGMEATDMEMQPMNRIQAEMMDEQEPSSHQAAGPIVLNALEQDSVDVATQNLPDTFWVNNSTGDKVVDLPQASKLEIKVASFEWSTTQVAGTKLLDISLPIKALSDNPNHAATMLFQQYAYWNGDIVVRLHVNTTPFHIGKLIMSWYYAEDFDANAHHRDNIASAYLLPHVEFFAAEGGDVVLRIPYRNYRSMLCTRKQFDSSKHLNLGNLRIHVFNPLVINVPRQAVDAYIHVNFENNSFTGLMPRSQIQPEMMPTRSLIKKVETGLDIVDKVLNMDKPPNPAVPIMYTPQFSDSFASGTNDVNNIHALRLNPSAQTPHPPGSSTTISETNIKSIIRQWGFLRMLSWETGFPTGQNLMRLPVSPELDFEQYYQTLIRDDLYKYYASVLPPVSALATLNAYNRGSIEYKIEMVCSKYHTGALAVSFTPCMKEVTLQQALESYYMTMDIGTSVQYVFKVPYINERPYNPRFNRSNDNLERLQLTPIGELNIFVLNALRVVSGSSDKVWINIYMRAGEDFELAVPVPPLYSVAYEYTNEFEYTTIYPNNTTIISGLATWRYMNDIYRDVLILKNGDGSDNIMQFSNIKPFTIYRYTGTVTDFQDTPFYVAAYVLNERKMVVKSEDFNFNVEYICMLIVNDDGNTYKYAIPFKDINSAHHYVNVWRVKARQANNPYCNSPSLDEWRALYPNDNVYYICVDSKGQDSYRTCSVKKTKLTFELEYVEPEGNDLLIDPTISTLSSTNNGFKMYGEQFIDLKDYCRRFQPYGSFIVRGEANVMGKRVRVPITPIGLDCNSKLDNGLVLYKTREGMIPYIASAYRFYRGSLRFKILVTQIGEDRAINRNTSYIIYLQHKPDIIVTTRDIVQKALGESTEPDSFLQSGYAYTAFSLSVNNSITIEIPCYIPTNLLLLQKPNFNLKSEILHYMNGALDIYFPSINSKDNYYVQLHMSIADDMDFSCYVGFPPMINLYKNHPSIRAEMDDFPKDNSYKWMPKLGKKEKKQIKVDNLKRKQQEDLIKEKVALEEVQDQLMQIASTSDNDSENSIDISAIVNEVSTDPAFVQREQEYLGKTLALSKDIINVNKISTNDTCKDTSKDISKVTAEPTSEVVPAKSEAQPEGLWNSTKDFFRNSKDKVMKKMTLSTVRSVLDLDVKENDSLSTILWDAVKKFGEEYKDIVIGMICSIVNCVIHPDVSSFVLAFVQLLAHISVRSFDYIVQFTNWFKTLFTKKTESQADDDKTEISSVEDAKSSIISLIVELGASTFKGGLEMIKNITIPDFSKGLFANIRFGAITLNVCFLLFKNLSEMLPRICTWIGKVLNPKQWYRWLFGKNQDLISKWISDVEFIIDPANDDKMTILKYVYHTELLVMLGRDIMAKLKMIGDNKNLQYITQLNTKLNQRFENMSLYHKGRGAIGLEPYCICVVGASQVGKTYCTRALSSECLEAIGYKSYGEIYYPRTATDKYWSNLKYQPILEYDDFLHITTPEATAQTLGELLLIKSKATFQPNMAHLEDKGMRYSPLVIMMSMNKPYPDFKEICQDAEAWQNRRDDLFTAIFVPPEKYKHAVNCNDLPDSELNEKMTHLRFKRHTYSHGNIPNADTTFDELEVPKVDDNYDLVSKDGNYEMVKTKELTFSQLKWYVRKRFSIKYDKMRKEYLKDLKNIQRFYPTEKDEFDMNIEIYLSHIEKMQRIMNSREKQTIEMARKMIKNVFCDHCREHIVNCACTAGLGKIVGQMDSFLKLKPKSNNAIKQFDYDSHRQKFVKELEKHVFFKHLPHNILTHITEIYMRNVRLNNIYPKLTHLLSRPCIHTLIDFMDTDLYLIPHFTRQAEPRVLLDQKLYDASLQGCDCEKLSDVVKTTIRLSFEMADLHIDYVKYPEFKYNQQKQIVRENAFIKMFEAERYNCFQEIAKDIKSDTWLGKLGSKIMQIAKPLSIIAGILLVMYGFHKLGNMEHEIDVKEQELQTQLLINKAFAARLANHIPTQDCINRGCPICTHPEMPYNEKIIVDAKRLKQADIKTLVPQMADEVKKGLDNSLQRNFFYIRATTPFNKQIVVRCLGLAEKYFIAIDHYFHKFESLPLGTQYEYCRPDYVCSLNLKDIKIHKIKNSALYICRLPNTFNSFKNIVSKIASARMVPNLSTNAYLYVPELPEEQHIVERFSPMWYQNRIQFHDDTLWIPGIVDESASTNVSSYWSYTTSGKGLCGSVLVSEMNVTNPIIGIHVAGQSNGGRGYSEVIVQETFMEFFIDIKNSQIVQDIQTESMDMNGEQIVFDPEPKKIRTALPGQREFIGVVNNKYAYKPPTKTKTKHSLCYNEITMSTYDYPHISHRDPRFEGSPMYNGCIHHVDPPLTFPQDLLDIAYDDIKNVILHRVIPLRQHVGKLSIEESIVGIPSIPHYDALEFNTSEGFPLSSLRPKNAKDKRWLFDLEVKDDGYVCHSVNKTLLNIMAVKSKLRDDGVVPATIFTDCLKDMKLPKEKAHKARIFSISPVDFTIQFRQLFYDFTIAFQEARFKVESAVGINVESYEWNDMIQMLLENSTHFVCGDYSKFGPRLMNKVVQLCFDIIIEWYKFNGDKDESNRIHRYIMGQEIAFSMHLMLNFVYQVMCGAPSGSPITTILNNMVNMFYIRCSYLAIMKEKMPSLRTMSDFHKNVKVIFYGDDLIMTVKPEILHLFNAPAISQFFAQYNITFTDALKTGEIQLSTSVFDKETSFLKRTTKRHPFRPVFMPVMDKRSVEETCNWIFEGHDEMEASLIACEAMMLNAHGLGPEYYEDLRSRIYSFWRQYDEYPIIPSWKEVDFRIYEGGI